MKGIVQSYTEGGHLIYYHTNGNNSDRMKVQLWTHQDDLYMKPKSNCPQKSYETVTTLVNCYSRFGITHIKGKEKEVGQIFKKNTKGTCY